MTRTSTDIVFAFDILTPDGDLIAEDISFTADLTGSYCPPEPDVGIDYGWYEDVEFTDIYIEATKPNPEHPTCFAGGKAHSVPLPEELKLAFDRWAESKDTQDRCQEWLAEGARDAADDACQRVCGGLVSG